MNGGMSQNARVLADAQRDLRLHKLAKRPDASPLSVDLWRKANELAEGEANRIDVGLLMIARDRINAAISKAKGETT